MGIGTSKELTMKAQNAQREGRRSFDRWWKMEYLFHAGDFVDRDTCLVLGVGVKSGRAAREQS